jgi:hypothetical protein
MKLIAIYFFIIVAVAIGWIMNVIDIINMLGGEIGTEFVFRCIGIVIVPLGSLLGYIL